MKRILCILLCGIVALTQAQAPLTAPNKKNLIRVTADGRLPRPMSFTKEFIEARQQLRSRSSSAGTRAVSTVPVGSAGNLYTILNSNVHRIAASTELNTVVFIHRSNDELYPLSNRGQYRYDVSYDGGNTWPPSQLDLGVLNPSGNQLTLAGRYPNVVIHNPQGNTNPHNAYLAYLGTWLPFELTSNPNWDGHFTGVARLNNDPATFTENISSPNNENILIATGLTNGSRGVFWALNFATEPFSSTTENITGILLFKGVWNQLKNDVDWILYSTIRPPYDRTFDNGLVSSGFADMAFDPTGQYGWIGMLADCRDSSVNNIEPVLYSTKDGGATWAGPIILNLSNFSNIVNNMPPNSLYPTTAGADIDIVTDIYGNPHLIAVIGGAASDSTIYFAGLHIYDITYNPAYYPECRWQAIPLSRISTISGDLALDDTGQPVSENNRPQAALSPDGKKVFVAWADSDTINNPRRENNIPDFLTRAYDVTTGLATATVNWTRGDLIWEGQALFASTAPTTLAAMGNYYVPTIFSEVNTSGLATDPAKFHYVRNIQYSNSDFNIDIMPPVITLNGTSPMTILVGTPFIDPGATAMDNVNGNLTSSIVEASNVNTSVAGLYSVTYSVSDAAGNAACQVTRIVRVVTNPDNTPPVITLLGQPTMTLDKCDFFNDPGATAMDNVDGNITYNIIVTSNLPAPLVPGTYTISYNVTDGAGNAAATVSRTVTVTDLPPAITLLGDNPLNIEMCNSFADPGGYGEDKCEGILTLTVTGSVDETTVGTYTLTYTANDGVNPPASAQRIVNITPDMTPPTIQILGPNPQYVYLGDSYNDPGAQAFDCINDTLTSSIISNASTVVNTSSRSDNYIVTYRVSDASGNSASATRRVIVNTEPDPDFTHTISTTNAATVNFTDASLYNPIAWNWDFGDRGFASTQPNPSHTYPANGTYTVCLRASNIFNQPPFSKAVKQTCKDITLSAVGIAEAAIEKSFAVYPNPTSGMLTVEISSGAYENVSLTISDIVGKEIQNIALGKQHSGLRLSVNLSGSPQGLYLIRIQTEQGAAVKRIAISR